MSVSKTLLILPMVVLLIGCSGGGSTTKANISVDELIAIDNSNTSSYSVSGNCSENGKSVSVNFKDSVDPASVSITKETTCTGGTWGINDINLFELYNGTITISVEHSGTTASGATVSKVGCTASPTPTELNGHGNEKANPIVICDYAGLKDIATHGLDKHYALGSHINAKGSWAEGAANCTAYDGTTVPSGGTPCNGWGLGNLTGALDGRGFQIRKLYRRTGGGKIAFGLFESLASSGTLENVHLRSVRIHNAGDSAQQGGLVGEAAGTIEHCSVSGVLSSNFTKSGTWSNLGGLVGYLRGGEIKFSKVFDFEILEGDDHYRAGGLAGLFEGSISSSSVEDSKIIAPGRVGGLVGESRGTSSIEDSYTLNTTVKGTGSDAYGGGLVGASSSSTFIINSFVKKVEVSGSGYVGGILGTGAARIYSSYVDSTSSVLGVSAGGLVGSSAIGGGIFYSYSHAPVQGSRAIGSVAGRIFQTEINRSYGAGSLSATSGSNPTIGGLVATTQSSHIHDSFWDTETTSQANSAGGGFTGTNHGGPFAGPGTALGTNDIKTDCTGGATTGICALGNAFVYEQGSYPKLKKCTENCSHSNILEHVHGEALLDGQGESLY